jgi:PadR family transcriptional regulator PadR
MKRRSAPEGIESWEAQLRKGSLELAILAVLWNSRLYGIDIIRTIREKCGLELAEGTIYPILNRLKADDYLNSEWIEAEKGHPRKYYWLTSKGQDRARALSRAWEHFGKSMDAVCRPILTNAEADK